jgi:hypothetical protein
MFGQQIFAIESVCSDFGSSRCSCNFSSALKQGMSAGQIRSAHFLCCRGFQVLHCES